MADGGALDEPLIRGPPKAATVGHVVAAPSTPGRTQPPPPLPALPVRVLHDDLLTARGQGASTTGSASQPPPLPAVSDRVRTGDFATRPHPSPSGFSTQSEPPPDAASIKNRIRYKKRSAKAASPTDSNRSVGGGEGTDAEDSGVIDDDDGFDDVFVDNSYNTVDFESQSFDVPLRSCTHLNLLPAVKNFALQNGYEASEDDLQLTFRAFFIGGIFAVINATVNMFFAFRYAGGLAQYWVILVSYPLAKATERLPRGLLNPGECGSVVWRSVGG
jgi:hypothetical protein